MNMYNKGSGLALFTIIFLSISNFVNAQYYPHNDSINYKENYRGQYHFSPRSEWMNDINGLVYQGGKYHMIYQWGNKIRHGGYATSHDLLHWKDQGVALIPQNSFLPPDAKRNVSGNEVYSGSAVVVSGETAMKITGSEKEAIIAIYTGTGKGTCLAWSNNNGKTWQDYQGNPVGNLTDDAIPRDPCVFWHEPSSKWILAIYENGTTFYGSSDLIQWDYLSNINFGYECPDMFQLPLDGDENNMKWVLLDANGSYLVGEFDGTTFRKDESQQTFMMDVGPDFYAAQTFPMGNLPNNDPRIIQIAWMDHWNGGIGEIVWERNATFPVSLGLKTLNEQIRITRNPINEISTIYENTKVWDSQLIKVGTNLLKGVHSKKFELSLEFDLTGSTALNLGIKVANRYIIYDLYNKTLLSNELLPDDANHISIKLLVDWGQLEVFGNEGTFSYTQQFAFSPDHDNIELFSDGDIQLISMEFHELARTW
ncbi:levanase [Reichenbachiella faecimaris]|uniref:Levanase n=1 Tax=Reichenbachiella faecimaris TaxID=692418 RepID=A0A1W2G809_REIFA|nr:glycoside hydrolase family 32 protein [Reichenbachiella faecimaris]SMD32815.1 levanase [Reichenbachiella faecimaris]